MKYLSRAHGSWGLFFVVNQHKRSVSKPQKYVAPFVYKFVELLITTCYQNGFRFLSRKVENDILSMG